MYSYLFPQKFPQGMLAFTSKAAVPYTGYSLRECCQLFPRGSADTLRACCNGFSGGVHWLTVGKLSDRNGDIDRAKLQSKLQTLINRLDRSNSNCQLSSVEAAKDYLQKVHNFSKVSVKRLL